MSFQPPLRPSRGHNNQGRGARSTASASAATAPAAPTASVISRATSAAATYETMDTDQIADNVAVFFERPEWRQKIDNDPKLARAVERVVTVAMAKDGAPTNVASVVAPASLAPTSASNRTPWAQSYVQRQQQAEEEEEEMGTGYEQPFPLQDPPPPPAEAGPDKEATECVHKAIDNMLYYEVLAARYATARRHSKASAPSAESLDGPGGDGQDNGEYFEWTEALAREEVWAVQSAAYWAKVRVKLVVANRRPAGSV